MDLDIPATLADINVPGDKIPEMADIALKVAVPIENNPRRPSRDDIIAIYEYALNG
jgi:alcohol dehydrogenase class IV